MEGPPTTCIDRKYRALAAASNGQERRRGFATVASMLAVPCGLPSYVGVWPPVMVGTAMIQPLAELAGSTPHSACACGGGALYGRDHEPAEELRVESEAVRK